MSNSSSGADERYIIHRYRFIEMGDGSKLKTHPFAIIYIITYFIDTYVNHHKVQICEFISMLCRYLLFTFQL